MGTAGAQRERAATPRCVPGPGCPSVHPPLFRRASRRGHVLANPYKDKVKVTFFHGARLPDTKGLFNAGLGGGKWWAFDLREGWHGAVSNEGVLSGRASRFIGLPGELLGAMRKNDARKHAGGPDVDGLAKIERFVERAALDVERTDGTAALMPEPGAALGTEGAVQRVPRICNPGPEPGRSPREMQCRSRHHAGDAKGRRGLFAALGAMADVAPQRAMRQLVTDCTALAAAAKGVHFCRHGLHARALDDVCCRVQAVATS